MIRSVCGVILIHTEGILSKILRHERNPYVGFRCHVRCELNIFFNSSFAASLYKKAINLSI